MGFRNSTSPSFGLLGFRTSRPHFWRSKRSDCRISNFQNSVRISGLPDFIRPEVRPPSERESTNVDDDTSMKQRFRISRLPAGQTSHKVPKRMRSNELDDDDEVDDDAGLPAPTGPAKRMRTNNDDDSGLPDFHPAQRPEFRETCPT